MDPEQQYLDKIKEAEKLFVAKKHAEALKTLDEAYAIQPNPNILYNKARIYEATGQLKEALATYKTFAAAPPFA